MEQISQSGSELGSGAPLPASSQLADRYDGLTTSFNTPEGEHRTPTLFRYVELGAICGLVRAFLDTQAGCELVPVFNVVAVIAL